MEVEDWLKASIFRHSLASATTVSITRSGSFFHLPAGCNLTFTSCRNLSGAGSGGLNVLLPPPVLASWGDSGCGTLSQTFELRHVRTNPVPISARFDWIPIFPILLFLLTPSKFLLCTLTKVVLGSYISNCTSARCTASAIFLGASSYFLRISREAVRLPSRVHPTESKGWGKSRGIVACTLLRGG